MEEMQQFRGSSTDLCRRLDSEGVPYDGVARDRIDFKEEATVEQKAAGNALLAGWDWNAPPCPESVYMFQLRKVMRTTLMVEGDDRYGCVLPILEAYIEEVDDQDLRDDFQAAAVRRDHDTVKTLALMFGWNDDRLDSLFRLAATL
jgi:hypothetical protein